MAELKHKIITITEETYLKRIEEIKEAARQEEREACIKLYKEKFRQLETHLQDSLIWYGMGTIEFVEAIRKRGEK